MAREFFYIYRGLSTELNLKFRGHKTACAYNFLVINARIASNDDPSQVAPLGRKVDIIILRDKYGFG